MIQDEDYRTAVFGKTERTVGWEGDGEPAMTRLVRHCVRGNPQRTGMPDLKSLSHPFTLDCNIYVRSDRAGQRVMESVTSFIEKRLKLKVNAQKSAVARPEERTFLGFTFTRHEDSPELRRAIAPKALRRFKNRVREITRRNRGSA
jgi:hypothetical protein